MYFLKKYAVRYINLFETKCIVYINAYVINLSLFYLLSSLIYVSILFMYQIYFKQIILNFSFFR